MTSDFIVLWRTSLIMLATEITRRRGKGERKLPECHGSSRLSPTIRFRRSEVDGMDQLPSLRPNVVVTLSVIRSLSLEPLCSLSVNNIQWMDSFRTRVFALHCHTVCNPARCSRIRYSGKDGSPSRLCASLLWVQGSLRHSPLRLWSESSAFSAAFLPVLDVVTLRYPVRWQFSPWRC